MNLKKIYILKMMWIYLFGELLLDNALFTSIYKLINFCFI